MHWFLDWDGTITTADTLSLVASIGYERNRHQNLPPWSHFSNAYGSDYSTHAAKSNLVDNMSSSLESFLAWQESFVDVERTSVERVERAGIFANVTMADISDAAKQAIQSRTVVLRLGFGALLEAIHHQGGRITVVNVNWSARFIHSCLSNPPGLFSENEGNDATIRANDIEPGPSPKLSRTFKNEDRGIWTAQDKARIMHTEVEAHPLQPTSVYVGDSTGDLPCLLLANVGICIRDEVLTSEQKRLQEIVHSLRIPCHRIGEYKHRNASSHNPARSLWWARNFDEICSSALLRSVQ
jgi:thiamine phosphate phosphatase / amino-HMP aminohydrolase